MLNISQKCTVDFPVNQSFENVLPLQREAPDAEALEEDTVGAEKEAALVGDEREGRRRSLMGAGPLLGQLHCLPSVEAERRERCDERLRQLVVRPDICMQINRLVITLCFH